jgi:DNA-binding XRE family transcriptional regulator
VTDSQILKVIGDNVKAARLRAGLTQECVAELVGVHWQTITYLEKGRYPFSVATFARLSQVLETSPNRLLDGLPEPDQKRITKIKQMMARRRRQAHS